MARDLYCKLHVKSVEGHLHFFGYTNLAARGQKCTYGSVAAKTKRSRRDWAFRSRSAKSLPTPPFRTI